jgi:hypothetical protein
MNNKGAARFAGWSRSKKLAIATASPHAVTGRICRFGFAFINFIFSKRY